jgi:radical SAM superfamily enzyme YgiQ (UPF0313 family)
MSIAPLNAGGPAAEPKLNGNRVVLAYPLPTRDSPVKLTPLSILYPGALFESRGAEVLYWDERFDAPEQLDEYIAGATDIGVSAFTGYQCGQAARILKRAKKLNPSIVTHLGGYHARLLPEQCKQEPYVDEIWTGRNYGEWLFPWKPHTKVHFKRTDMQYYTSRGCPFPCTFCALRSSWEPKDIESLERELKTIHDEIGFTEISFSDPNIGFGVYKDDEDKTVRMDRVKRMRAIGQVMRDLNVKWDGNIRSPYLTPEMIDTLAWGNCTSIEIGCESGNDEYLRKTIRKGHGVDAIRNAAINVKGSPISVMYSFLAFGPHETDAQRRDTYDLIDWIVDTDPLARVSLYKFAPYPGSPLYDDAVAGRGTGFGCDVFNPPKNMEEWGKLKLMVSPIYWITGLCFRMDNTAKNFSGDDWKLIEPYVDLAKARWKNREMEDFPIEEVERLVQAQVLKQNAKVGEAFMVAGA